MRIVTILAAFLLFIAACVRSNKGDNPSFDAAQPAGGLVFEKLKIQPPLAKISVEQKVFRVKNGESQHFDLKNGGSIDVPAAAFVDKNGQPVTAEVELRFREFHTAGEIIASGIPLRAFDGKAEEGHLETAGMFEVSGFSNGEAVFIAPEKKLTVNLSSDMPGRYDAWFFDPEKGNWTDIGDWDALPNPVKNLPPNQSADERTTPKIAPPAAPVAVDKTRPSLNFNVDYAQFPDLKAMKGMVLQYAGNDPKVDPKNNDWIFKHAWDDIALKPGTQPDTYVLNLESDSKTYSIAVQPCLSGAAFDNAMRDYKTQLAGYKQLLEAAKNAVTYRDFQANYIRTMGIGKFGIFNYDIFSKIPDNVRLMADFDFGKNLDPESKKLISVYLIYNAGKGVISFDHYAWQRFAFDPRATDNSLLAVLPDGRTATVSAAEFNKMMPEIMAARDKNFTFKMTAQPKAVGSVKGLDEVIDVVL